jgi:formate dehydrogenase maturation protein FdhE
MGEIDQEHCPICGREFDFTEPVVFFGARGPTYSYCNCSKCKRAWEIGQFKFGSTKIERREVEYIENNEW